MTTSPGVNVTIIDLDAAPLPLTEATTWLEVVYYDTNGNPRSGKLAVSDLLAVLALRVTNIETRLSNASIP